VVDLLVEEVAAVNAVAVDGEQDRDAVSGAGDDLAGLPSGVQSQRRAGVAQVVRAAGEPVGGLVNDGPKSSAQGA
jgi:hypothetical protein